jgi:hypothetical protein
VHRIRLVAHAHSSGRKALRTAILVEPHAGARWFVVAGVGAELTCEFRSGWAIMSFDAGRGRWLRMGRVERRDSCAKDADCQHRRDDRRNEAISALATHACTLPDGAQPRLIRIRSITSSGSSSDNFAHIRRSPVLLHRKVTGERRSAWGYKRLIKHAACVFLLPQFFESRRETAAAAYTLSRMLPVLCNRGVRPCLTPPHLRNLPGRPGTRES